MNVYTEPAHLPACVKKAAAALLAVALLLTLLCPLRAAAEDRKGLLQAIREAENNGGKELSVDVEKNTVIDEDLVIPANLRVFIRNCKLCVSEGAVLTIDGSLFMGGDTGRIELLGTARVNGSLVLENKAVMEVDGSLYIEKKGYLQIWNSNRLTIRGSLVNRNCLLVQDSSRVELFGSYVNEKDAHLSMEDSSVFVVAKEASYTDEGGLWVDNRSDCGITGEGAPVYVQDEKGNYVLQSELERRREKERKEEEAAQEWKERQNVRIRYVDPLTGASFSAPGGWIRYREDVGEEKRVVFYEDIPFSLIIVTGNMLIYQSLDLWDGMTEQQKQELPREKLDTALLSRNIVANLVNVSQMQLTRWTCDGRVYYLYSGEKTVEYLGKIRQAFAVCIVNGCLYRFTVAVGPMRTDDPADILKDVLTTAEYPTPAPAPAKGGGLAEWGIGFGIAALILIVGTWLEARFKKLRKPTFRNSHTARLLLMLLGVAILMAVEIWLERQGQGSKSRMLVYTAALIMVRELIAFFAEGRALRKQGEKKKHEDPAPSAPEELTEELTEEPTEEPTQETEPADQADAGEQGPE